MWYSVAPGMNTMKKLPLSCEKLIKHEEVSRLHLQHEGMPPKTGTVCTIEQGLTKYVLLLSCFVLFTSLFALGKIAQHNRFGKCSSEHKVLGLQSRDGFHL